MKYSEQFLPDDTEEDGREDAINAGEQTVSPKWFLAYFLAGWSLTALLSLLIGSLAC